MTTGVPNPPLRMMAPSGAPMKKKMRQAKGEFLMPFYFVAAHQYLLLVGRDASVFVFLAYAFGAAQGAAQHALPLLQGGVGVDAVDIDVVGEGLGLGIVVV